MLVAFEDLADDSRIWIYQSSRLLNSDEQQKTSQVLASFCEQWTAHGNPLKASYEIETGQFLVLAVDENWSNASGCSIDGSVKILKNLQKELSVDFFDRTKVAFLIENEVKTISLNEIKGALSAGILSAATLTFNTLVATKEQLRTGWLQPLHSTWLAKYLTKTATE